MVKILFMSKQVAIALDQLANAITGGWADETLSARSWRCREKPVPIITLPLINTIFFWQDNHCKSAYESEKEMKQLPPEYRSMRNSVNSMENIK